jgi:hypothetical protein
MGLVTLPEVETRTLDLTTVNVSQTGIVSLTNIDITDLTVSFQAPVNLPYIVRLQIPSLLCTAGAPGTFIAVITDAADVEQAPICVVTNTTANLGSGLPPLEVYFQPSSGTKNYKARCRVAAAVDAFTIQAAIAPISLRAFVA